MSSALTCQQTYYKTPTEVRNVQVDMQGVLRQGEVLTGTPTITVTGPTASSPVVTSTLTLMNGQTVEAGKGITFTISGGTDGTTYAIKVSCGTSSSETVETYCTLIVATS